MHVLDRYQESSKDAVAPDAADSEAASKARASLHHSFKVDIGTVSEERPCRVLLKRNQIPEMHRFKKHYPKKIASKTSDKTSEVSK